MYYTIYRTTNLINGKTYIGKHKTNNLEDDYIGSGKILLAAVQKYGTENFQKEILYVFPTELEMNEKEAELVNEEYIASSETYNIKLGGNGGWDHIEINGMTGKTQTQKARDAARRTLARNASAASCAKGGKNSPGFSGKHHTPEAKARIGNANSKSQSLSGNSQYGTIWITNGDITRKIRQDDEIPVGWRRGRTLCSGDIDE